MIQLFLLFFKIGLFVFGGGYAMIGFVESECVEKRGWLDLEEFQNVCAIAESTPGPIAINLATYVGRKRQGVKGAVAATLGVVTPSFLIIFTISRFFNRFLEIEIVASAFAGIKVAVGVLIFKVALTMVKRLKKSAFSWILMGVMCAALLSIEIFALNFSSLWLIAAGAAAGLLLYAVSAKKEEKDDLS
ncbi:MAG: chromate transporter [Clostridia bacterium]|nr:chromate transporter [Clostridia bacterium]